MKPLLILDNHFRTKAELFRDETFDALAGLCDIRGGADAPMSRKDIEALLPDARFYVASKPELSAEDLRRAPNLRATIEVAGAFREGLDYDACFDRGIEVLSCSPGFRNAVAEMTVAMILGAGRGLVDEHEAFRSGTERWLDDRPETDFTLYHQSVGFIGYGQISKETHRLIRPFQPKVMAFDPFLKDAGPDVELTDLEQLVSQCRVVVVAAVPSEDTRGLLSAALIGKLQKAALVVVISRAWCADFDALVAAAGAGQIKFATDVFPDEPLAVDHPLRQMPNVILSPHRAAAVPGGRHLIGDMILQDVQAILEGLPSRQLKPADRQLVAGLVSAQAQLKSMPNT
ncbi:2-hydroxyacid dehydrogenase [Actibacterium mucosum KCTC 23349]|uniref:2-hydroxyacid dehydrogenase n=1 Tax=Actibacterium mucosum KCTC 23349 TaxID=1454373 RepID=A0A037ZHF8_9RHOB|nr:NAD(P)-dependent oxidoreductase [Actibacterium mucosum]KAJ54957.1 2-hydroxyacid dehydrogenase [Actibacterium mucosum KCTC 23349]